MSLLQIINKTSDRFFQKVDASDVDFDTRDYRCFLLIVVLYPIFQLITEPSWLLSGEMWAEMATNYFVNANSSSWMSRLFATDAGYIPLLQRLISLLGTILNIPNDSIPYYYTWTATILTGVMGGIFCLPCFRPLVQSDLYRFCVSAILLLSPDFETKTFINFSYINVVPISFISALVIIKRQAEVPKWCWVLPILFFSKPAVMASLPMVLFAALFSTLRFRLIAGLSLFICLVQAIVIHSNESIPGFSDKIHYSLAQRLHTIIHYFFTVSAEIFLGSDSPDQGYLIYSGLGIVSAFLIIFLFKGKGNSLVWVGFFLIACNLVINSFALSNEWNVNFHQIGRGIFARHAIIMFFGGVIALSGVVQNIYGFFPKNLAKKYCIVPSVVIIWWFFSTNTFLKVLDSNRVYPVPVMGNSLWQAMIPDLITVVPTLCVPIDPIFWTYGACRNLGENLTPSFAETPTVPEQAVNTHFQGSISAGRILLLAIIAKPVIGSGNVKVSIIVETKDGRKVPFFGERMLGKRGGLIPLKGGEPIGTRDIANMSIFTDSPVNMAVRDGYPLVIPFGQ